MEPENAAASTRCPSCGPIPEGGVYCPRCGALLLHGRDAARLRYATIVADPPWQYESFWSTSHNSRTGAMSNAKRVDLPYPSMSVDDISALPVADLAADDAFVFLWTTNRYIGDAFAVLAAWGFTYKQTIVWAKSKDHCIPATIAPIHAEFLLVGKRGTPKRVGTFPSSVIEAPRTKQHSAKPELFLDLIEASCPSSRIELFSRRARLGWDTWGDEALHGTEPVA